MPIRSSRSFFHVNQIKLAALGIFSVGICVTGIVFAVSRFQLVEQINKDKAANLPQSKPTIAEPVLKPTVMQPTQLAVVGSFPTRVETQMPISPLKETEDLFTNPKPRIPIPMQPIVAPTPSISTLIEQLSDKDETVRLKAAKELERLKEKAKEAIPALKTALTDADEDVREVAKKSLSAIQAALELKAEPVKPEQVKPNPIKLEAGLAQLVKDLKSKDNKVRLSAISKLQELGEDAKPVGAALVEFGMMSPIRDTRDAANTAMEKIDPLIYKEIITLYYDNDSAKKDIALVNFTTFGTKAKSALPVIKAYSELVLSSNLGAHPKSIIAMVSIAADDESVQLMVFKLVASPYRVIGEFNKLGDFVLPDIREHFARKAVVTLMHDLKIEDKLKIAPLLTGFVASDNSDLIKEIGKLDAENKMKLTVLLTALTKKSLHRVLIINEIGKLGADAKTALPVLNALKTDSEQAVRAAAIAAIESIKE